LTDIRSTLLDEKLSKLGLFGMLLANTTSQISEWELLELGNHATQAIENFDADEVVRLMYNIIKKPTPILDIKCNNKKTMLHFAITIPCSTENLSAKNEILQLLIDGFEYLHQDLPNLADEDKNTMLHLMSNSANRVRPDIFKQFFDKMSRTDGFTIDCKDGNGKTMLDIANESGAEEIADIIKQYKHSKSTPKIASDIDPEIHKLLPRTIILQKLQNNRGGRGDMQY
jgi:hypothetical protein